MAAGGDDAGDRGGGGLAHRPETPVMWRAGPRHRNTPHLLSSSITPSTASQVTHRRGLNEGPVCPVATADDVYPPREPPHRWSRTSRGIVGEKTKKKKSHSDLFTT